MPHSMPVASVIARQSCLLSAFATPRGRWIGLVVFGPETSVGIVQLFFDRMVTELEAVAPREPAWERRARYSPGSSPPAHATGVPGAS